MKYVRYSIAALGVLVILFWAGHWVFAKEHMDSPFAYPVIARGNISWGAVAAGLLGTTWKERFLFAGFGAAGTWILLHGVYFYHVQMFPS